MNMKATVLALTLVLGTAVVQAGQKTSAFFRVAADLSLVCRQGVGGAIFKNTRHDPQLYDQTLRKAVSEGLCTLFYKGTEVYFNRSLTPAGTLVEAINGSRWEVTLPGSSFVWEILASDLEPGE
jgi:hypothetical protein